MDTTKPIQVVTQFETEDGTDNTDVVKINRFFVQDGKKIEHPMSKTGGDKEFDHIDDEMCEAHKKIFEDPDDFKKKGGMSKMSKDLEKGMVLVMSLWDDSAANMLWLDSTYPTDKTAMGGPRGTCSIDSGKPADVRRQSPNAYVSYSDIRFGEIGSTTNGGGGGCPGGNLSACMGLCPTDPAEAFKACVQTCVAKCPSQAKAEAFLA